jgi:hypothetical protein
VILEQFLTEGSLKRQEINTFALVVFQNEANRSRTKVTVAVKNQQRPDLRHSVVAELHLAAAAASLGALAMQEPWPLRTGCQCSDLSGAGVISLLNVNRR